MSTSPQKPEQKPVATAPVADTSVLPTVVDVPAPSAAAAENPVPATNRDTPILIKGEQPTVTPQPSAEVTQLAQAPVVPTVNVQVTLPSSPAAQGPTVKVKFLRSHPSFGNFAGDEAEISQEAFDKYSQDGPFFEEVKPAQAAKSAEKAADTPPETGLKERKQTR